MRTFKLLSLLLAYPTEGLQQHMDELKAALADDGLITAKMQRPLFEFMDDLARRNLMRLQEDYVGLFDRSRAHSLYIFEHIHGESRDRGQAMVDLSDHYISHGVTLSANELPDYLPLFLEFLAQIDFAEAQELLGETIHIIAGIGAKLKAKKSGYHQIFRALEALSTVKVDPKFLEQAVSEAAAEDTSNEALDKDWEDAPAFDGTGQTTDCNVCPSATRHSLTNPQSGAAPTATH
jgi:nitrate reductase molybdenum cofactor assembly chaperone NarJ/NarW